MTVRVMRKAPDAPTRTVVTDSEQPPDEEYLGAFATAWLTATAEARQRLLKLTSKGREA